MTAIELTAAAVLVQATLCANEIDICYVDGVPEREIVPRNTDGSAYDLGIVTGMNVGPDGNLYVLQPQDYAVLVIYDGDTAGKIGRAGEGPGEFQLPSQLGWKGDSLWVVDRRLRRVTLFDANGEHVRDWSVPSIAGGRFPLGSLGAVLSAGDMIFAVATTGTALAEGTVGDLPVLRIDEEGTVIDTLASVNLHDNSMAVIVDPDAGLRMSGRQPFSRSDLLAVRRTVGEPVVYVIDRSSIDVTPDGARYVRVRKIGVTGDVVADAKVTFPAERIAEADVDAAIDRLMGGIVERLGYAGRERRAMRRRLLAAIHVPEYWPGVDKALVDDDGRVWLRRWGGRDAAGKWLLLDQDGNLTARVRLPTDVELYTAKGDRAWGVRVDQLDIPHLIVLTLQPSDRNTSGGEMRASESFMHRSRWPT